MLCSVSEGYIMGHMAGMVSGLLSGDSDVAASGDDVALIASVGNITCVLGFLVAGILAETLGRRATIAILSAPNVVNWLVVWYTTSVATLLATRITVGISFGGVLVLTELTTAEYMPSNVRGVCLSLISVGLSFGVMLAHILSILMHWRTVALFGIIPSGLSVLMPLLWVESPQWLASKGKFEQCERAFKALNSHRDSCNDELRMLIELEKRKQTEVKKPLIKMTKLRAAVKKKFFWVLLFLSTMITTYTVATGTIPFHTYAINMMQEMTGSTDILWYTVVVDGLAVLGSCCSSLFLTIMNMRTVLFSGAITANVLLLTLSATLYFKTESIILQWFSCILLGLYFVMINAGPKAVLSAFIAEMYPLELKGFYFLIGGLICGLASFMCVMVTPALVAQFNYSGTFLLNTVIMSICLVFFWKHIPETKGKTLQEIEMHFKNNGVGCQSTSVALISKPRPGTHVI